MAESRDNNKWKNYLELHWRVMIWSGANRPYATHPLINLLFILRVLVIIVTYIVLLTGCMAHMKIVTKFDLLASSMNVLQSIIYVMGILHIVYYQSRNGAAYRLILKIREGFRFTSNTGHYTMEKPVRLDRRRSLIWTMLCILAAAAWFFMAMFQGEDPVPVWAPVNLLESPYYYINTCLQFAGQFWIGAIGGCFGSFYMSVVSLYKCQFDMLLCSLEHIGPLAVLKMRGRIRNENKMSGEITLTEGSFRECECCTEEFKRFFENFEKRRTGNALTLSEINAYEKELFIALKDCIDHHQSILKLKETIEDFLGPVIFIRFFLSTLMLCFTIYSTSKFTAKVDFSPTDMRFLSLVEYFVMAVGELFIFSFIAERLLLASLMIPDTIYEKLPWHGGGVTKKFISTLQIFHLSGTKAITLRTPFYEVSFKVLTAMLRASFSFYTLLRKVQ